MSQAAPPGMAGVAAGSIADPQSPHDDLSFDELGRRYNYELTSDRRRVLVRLLLKEFAGRPGPIRVLDVGCGTGISDEPGANVAYLRAVRERAGELWGVEPDTSIRPDHGLFDQFRHAVLEEADLPEGYFDVAFSYFVMEHVDDPVRFMRALHRTLRPGGVYLFITPNGRHYFTRLARFFHAVKLDEWVLRLVRGRQQVERYHYPVRYRFNHARAIAAVASATGFEPPEFAFIERGGPRPYFKGPFLAIFYVLAWKRHVIRRKDALLEMFCRLRKPLG